jgi:hypothetical protein
MHSSLRERKKRSIIPFCCGVGSDELLTQPVLLAARCEMLGGEHLTVVAALHRARLSSWEHQPVTQQTCLLQGLLGILSPPSLAHMKSYDLAVVTVDHSRDPDPSILCAIRARHINRPTLAWLLALRHRLLHAVWACGSCCELAICSCASSARYASC